MQVKQSVVSGNGEQKASKNSKVESVAVLKTGAVNALGGTPKSAQLQDMSAYLKIVSRLENLNARQDNLPEPAIQGFIQGLRWCRACSFHSSLLIQKLLALFKYIC